MCTGTAVAQYVYNPYGKLSTTESVDGATWNNYLFTGQMLDRTTGLYYLRARFYDPGVGRFISRDTIKGNENDPLSLHRYSYCVSDSVNRTDPTGHSSYTEVGVSASIIAQINSISAISAFTVMQRVVAGAIAVAMLTSVVTLPFTTGDAGLLDNHP
ncbi:MAG: RHS repeat-associated core domain-containing protein [Armatimonadota bacterium]|nr:RHS repeat-associated core domain-containing protein [bacterium]